MIPLKFGNLLSRRFWRNESGTTALMFGVSVIPIFLAAGAAIDHGNAVQVRARLQAALDPAALAAGRKAGSDQQKLYSIASDYFYTNWSGLANTSTPTLQLQSTPSKLTLTASVEVENYVTRIVGLDSTTVVASTEVTKDADGLEVVLVFDNTGSMASEGRLSTLKVAARDFIDILFGDRATAEKLKVGVVPFSSTVNIGTQYANSGWIDKTGASPDSRYNFTSGSGWHNWKAWSDLSNRSWTGCVEARTEGHEVSDEVPTAAVPESLFPPYFAPDEPGNASSNYQYVLGNYYFNTYLADSGGVTTTVDLRGRRKTIYDLDGMQLDPAKYSGASVSVGGGRGPDWGCGVTPITPLTGNKATVQSALDAMVANGATTIPIGVTWGMRVLSPNEPFTQGVDYDNTQKIKKVMVLLTDGENDVGSGGAQLQNHNRTWYNSFGYASQGRLGSGSITSYSAFSDRLDALTRSACNLVKDPDGDGEDEVTVYTFAYKAPTRGQDLMRYCASGEKRFFDPPSNEALVQNFQQIADELRNLYLSQ